MTIWARRVAVVAGVVAVAVVDALAATRLRVAPISSRELCVATRCAIVASED